MRLEVGGINRDSLVVGSLLSQSKQIAHHVPLQLGGVNHNNATASISSWVLTLACP